MWRRALLLVLAWHFASACAARACGAVNPLFTDNFATLQPSVWGEANIAMHVANGHLVLQTAPKHNIYALAKLPFPDIDFCASATLLDAPNEGDYYLGMLFWAADNDNLYSFEANARGVLSLVRYVRGKASYILNDRADPDFRTGIGAVNELRVVASGTHAVFFVNGKKFDEIDGSPPAGPRLWGFYGEGVGAGVGTFAYSNVVVSLAPEPEPKDTLFPPAEITQLSADDARIFAALKQYQPDFSSLGYVFAGTGAPPPDATSAEINLRLKPVGAAQPNAFDGVSYRIYRSEAERTRFIEAVAKFQDPWVMPVGVVKQGGFRLPGDTQDRASCAMTVMSAPNLDWVRCVAGKGDVASIVTLAKAHRGATGPTATVDDALGSTVAKMAIVAAP